MCISTCFLQQCQNVFIVTALSTALLFFCLAKCEHNDQQTSESYRSEFVAGDRNGDMRLMGPNERTMPRIVDRDMLLERTIGVPRAICTNISIGIYFETLVPFEGTVSASRRIGVPQCSRKYGKMGQSVRFELPLMSSNCGITVRRSMNPDEAIDYSIRLIVIWGETISEDDQMFDVHCRFSRFKSIVGTFYEVGIVPSWRLSSEHIKPECRYTVRMQSIDGPITMLAQIGDVVYHKWECNAEHYAIKVNECYVHDGQEKKYLLVDENGCVTDTDILSELVYDNSSRMVHAKSRVFRFANSNRVFFNCLLYVCPSADPECRKQTKPKCGTSKRNRRNVYKTEILTVTPLVPIQDHRSSNYGRKKENVQNGDCGVYDVECKRQLTSVHISASEEVITQTSALNDRPDEPGEACTHLTVPENIYVVLVVSNFISLTIATVAILALFRNYFSANLSLYGSTVTVPSYH